MHLVDGGVLKDLLTFMRDLAKKSGNRVSEDVEKARRLLNKFRTLEQSRELRYVRQMLFITYIHWFLNVSIKQSAKGVYRSIV